MRLRGYAAAAVTRIATELGLSDKTVANYVSSILSALHARDREALAVLVREKVGQ